MVNLYPEIAPVSFELQLHQVYQDEFSIGDLKIKCAPTGHTPDSVAYRLEDGTHSMVYSGDATSRGELARLAEGVDVLISECSFPSGWETEDHLNADSLGEIAEQAGAKALVVVHSYPPALAVDLIGQIHHHYHGETQLAVDGLRLSL
jgi:ribonuclease BN (tRNA processing enzyme)